jgi:hypothetical protein
MFLNPVPSKNSIVHRSQKVHPLQVDKVPHFFNQKENRQLLTKLKALLLHFKKEKQNKMVFVLVNGAYQAIRMRQEEFGLKMLEEMLNATLSEDDTEN